MFFDATMANTISAINVGLLSYKQFIKSPIVPINTHTIDLAYKQFSKSITIPVCTHTINLLYKLQSLGVIQYISLFEVKGVKHAKIVLHFPNEWPIYKGIVLISKPKRIERISWKHLSILRFYQDKIVIVSTDKGILTAKEAYDLHIGGVGLCYLKL